MNRKDIVLVLIVVAVVAGWFLFKYQSFSQKNVIENKLPEFFPKELVGENNAQIQVIGDTSKLANEKHRALVSYKSSISVEENRDYFTQYFKNNSFETQVNELEDFVMLSATKQGATLSVTIWKRSPVQISILYILK